MYGEALCQSMDPRVQPQPEVWPRPTSQAHAEGSSLATKVATYQGRPQEVEVLGCAIFEQPVSREATNIPIRDCDKQAWVCHPDLEQSWSRDFSICKYLTTLEC